MSALSSLSRCHESHCLGVTETRESDLEWAMPFTGSKVIMYE